MRNINLWTILICLTGGWYVAKFYPRDHVDTNPMSVANRHIQAPAPAQPTTAPPTQQEPQQQAFTPPPVLYKCQTANGKTAYKDTPCPEATTATAIQQPVKTQPTALESQIERDMAAATARKRADEELARQWDQRIAQRDRDLANEQASLTAQTNAAGAACAALRQEKEAVLANLRHGGNAQWMNFWNQRFHVVSDALYRNHC